MLTPKASLSMMNILEKFGRDRMGLIQMENFNLQNYSSTMGDHLKNSLFTKAMSGATIFP